MDDRLQAILRTYGQLSGKDAIRDIAQLALQPITDIGRKNVQTTKTLLEKGPEVTNYLPEGKVKNTLLKLGQDKGMDYNKLSQYGIDPSNAEFFSNLAFGATSAPVKGNLPTRSSGIKSIAKMTEKELDDLIARQDAEFAQRNKTIPTQNASGKFMGSLPKKFKELEQKVLNKWGKSTPDNASFITSDGEFIGWGGGGERLADHREIVGDVVEAGGTEGLTEYMNKTGNIRIHNTPNIPDVNIDVTYMPNKKQLEAVKKMVQGKDEIYADISTKTGSTASSGKFNSFDEWLNWVKRSLGGVADDFSIKQIKPGRKSTQPPSIK